MVILDAERFGIAQLTSCADAWGGGAGPAGATYSAAASGGG